VDGLLPVDYLMNYVELKEVVGRFLAEVLGSVEELVVRLRFGIFGVMTYRGESLDLDFTVRYADGLTLDEVGELIERSRSRVKQIEDCALRKLRRRRRVLRDFYGERGRGVVRRRKVKPGERKPYYGEP
jgi:DNA-directed RNA polymerase sigma subunit (sigma70/sigma32)